MAEFKIEMANLVIAINSLFPLAERYCKNYLTQKENIDFSVLISSADIEYEREKSIKEFEYEGLEYPNFSDEYLELTAIYRKIADVLPSFNGLVFHGSAIAVGDTGYLFTAKSGTGKTTHTNLWLKNIPGCYVVNGDKPILRLIDDKVYVYGTPWSGKEGMNKNTFVQLKNVCELKRGTDNSISSVELKNIVGTILQQAYRPTDGAGLMKSIKMLDEMGKVLNFYVLYCNMDDEASFVSYNGMEK